MANGRLDLGDGWSTTADLTIALGADGFEFADYDVTAYTKETSKGTRDGLAPREAKLEGGGDVDALWLGNTSRVMDGADSKDARKELGHKLDAVDVLALIGGEIEDENIDVVDNGDGSYTITFENAKNDDIKDVLNVTLDLGQGTLGSGQGDFINDDSKSTSTVVLASDDPKDSALLGYQKNFQGSNAKSEIAYEVVANSVDGVENINPERSLNLDKDYEVTLVQETAISETYQITNGQTKKGEEVVDTITFFDDTSGPGLFDLGVYDDAIIA